MKRSRTGVAVAIGFAALVLGACGPAGVQDAGHGSATTSAVATTTEASPSATTAPPTPTSAPTTTDAATPTTAPPTTAPAPAVHATTRPPVHRTTPPPVHHTTAPPVHHTSAPPKPATCSIRSNAGNCYKAGQFCRKADLGRTTTDANGRAITCKIVSGQPHWHY